YHNTVGGFSSVSDEILCTYIRNLRKDGMRMSDFELLSIVLMILGIVVTLLLKIIENTNTKK
ncbi:MAG: hypothetical protein IKA09_06130, partial [Lachnospiraceae bacterium]|nr:hypothetical protein [Lachnospiraceae bacterium]